MKFDAILGLYQRNKDTYYRVMLVSNYWEIYEIPAKWKGEYQTAPMASFKKCFRIKSDTCLSGREAMDEWLKTRPFKL
jgi:hypothetical protein